MIRNYENCDYSIKNNKIQNLEKFTFLMIKFKTV